jgi:hypothetical protein
MHAHAHRTTTSTRGRRVHLPLPSPPPLLRSPPRVWLRVHALDTLPARTLPPAARPAARLLLFHLGTPACGAPGASSCPRYRPHTRTRASSSHIPATSAGGELTLAVRGAAESSRKRWKRRRGSVREGRPAGLGVAIRRRANCCSACVCVSRPPARPTDRRWC